MKRKLVFDWDVGAWYEPAEGRWWYRIRSLGTWASYPYPLRSSRE